MLIELGNASPRSETPTGFVSEPGPAVTYVRVPDGPDEAGNPLYSFPAEHSDDLFPAPLAADLATIDPENLRVRRALVESWLGQSRVNGLPNHAALQALIDPNDGLWRVVSAADPTWVWSDNDAYMNLVARHYNIPAGRPADLEDAYYTQRGSTVYSPGVHPPVDLLAFHVDSGRDQQSTQMFGWGYLGTVGTATATTSTSLTGSAETGASHTANDCVGQTLYASLNSAGAGSTVYGLITANTSGTTPVYTVDRWYAAAAPGGAAGTTPNATATYQVISGGQSSLYVGLSANTTPVVHGDTTLPGEITTASGGLIRKITAVAHTAAAATVVDTVVFTANGSDTLPVTIGKAGLSQSITSGYANSYQTLVSPTATLSASGDALTLTWTFTLT